MLACDLMGLTFKQLKWAPRLLPAFQALFDVPALEDEEADALTRASIGACSHDHEGGGAQHSGAGVGGGGV